MALAGDHQYVLFALTTPENRKRSVCLACGIPPALHGANALADARQTFDYENVKAIKAEPEDAQA